jgi:lysophospholipase L1-like esterase
MRFAKTAVFRFLSIVISVTLTVGVLLIGLKIFDAYLLSDRHGATPDDDADEPTMRTMDYYPFTGGQIQAFKTERKPLWSNYYDDFDVTSGEYGFFIDFHLETPPPKQDNEIRIVLTGGSTAQGWGGRTNADMFYQLLPTRLSQELQQQGRNCRVTVVNLAMGSSHIYQNFIALNKWAHPLQPDAIISFSGANEMAVLWNGKGDGPYILAPMEGGFLYVLRYSASPRWLKTIAEYYPGLVKRTMLGSLVRLMYLSDYIDDWKANYFLSRVDSNFRPMPREELQQRYRAEVKPLTIHDIVDSVSIPLYEHSLESISRDFPDTPIFAVFQPLQPYRPWLEDYARMTTEIPRKLNDEDHYGNVKFLNLQKVWQEHDFFPGSMVDPVHLSNDGHKRVTTYLSDWLFPFVQDRCAQLMAAKAAPAQHAN